MRWKVGPELARVGSGVELPVEGQSLRQREGLWDGEVGPGVECRLQGWRGRANG